MPKFENDLITSHSYDIFLPTRTLYLFGEICEDLFQKFLKNLHALDSTSGPINIKLNTEGGDMSAAKGIYDAIFSCKNLVRIICYAEVSSAGTVILQAADERCMQDNCTFMMHIGAEGYGMAHPRNIDNAIKNSRRDEQWMISLYLEKIKVVKPRITRKKVEELLEFDAYLTAKECLELNLIDFIGDPQ